MALSVAVSRRLCSSALARPLVTRGFYHFHGREEQVVRVPSPLSVARLTKMDYKINGMMELRDITAE